MHVKRKTYLTVAAVFAFMFLLLLNFIPGGKASAATKNYPDVPYTGDKISYYNSNVSYFSDDSRVSIYCSSRGSFTITVNPNTSAKSRTITLYSMKGDGTTVDTLCISQSGVPTTTINAACTGGNYTHGFSGVYSATSDNTSICSGLTSDKKRLIVKPSTSTSVRNCTVTLKNSSSKVIAYVYIKQSAVPTKTINSACTGGNYTHGISGVYSATSNNTSICSGLTSDKKRLIVKPSTSTSVRDCKVTLKNSSNKIIAYVYIKQAAVPVKNVSLSGGYTSFDYYKSGAYFSDTPSQVYNVTCSNPYSYTLYVTANPNASASRTFDVIATNSSGAYLEIIKVTQEKTAYSTETSNYNSDPRTITLSAANADYSKTVISNTSMCTKGSTSTKFNLTQNTSTDARSCTVTFKDKYGAIVKKCVIKQAGVPTKTINAACTGGNYTHGFSGVNSATSDNTSICSGLTSDKKRLIVKPSTSTSVRDCKVTLKNSSNKIIAYVYIKQAAVPVKNVSLSGGYTSFDYYKSGAYFSDTPSQVYNVTCSNPYSYTLYVTANPNASASRTFDVIATNSSGAYLEIIKVTQEKYIPATFKYIYSSDPRTLTYTCANADSSKTVVSNTSMLSCTSISSGKFQIKLKQNPNSTSRKCTITFKDKFGTVLQKRVITQNGVPVKYATVSGNRSAKLSYGNSKVSDFKYSSTYVSKITSSNPGSFTIYFYANPSTTKTRSFDIIAKDSKGVYVEIIRVTQRKFTPLTISKSVDSKRNTFTYTNSDAAKFTYSVSSMFGDYKSLGSGKYQFVVNANRSSSRTGTIFVYDKKGTVIEKISVNQSAVVTYTVGSGTGENITYTNANAATFNLPINIKSVRKVSTGKYAFTQTVNLGKDKLTGVISVLDKNGNVIEYLKVVSTPVVMNIKGNFDEKIPNIGKTYTGTFETSNPVKITLTNATFKDGKSTMTISKNALNANGSFSTPFEINVKTWSGTADRKVTIKVTSVSNGLTLKTMTLTQLGQQIGFRGATAEYPLGSLGRDHYVYKIATSVGSDWTKIDYVSLKDTGFDLLAAICTELNDECVCLLDHAVVNAQKVIYNGVDNCYVYATFYKDSSDNRYVIITGNDSSTDRGFDNFPAEGIYGSDKSFKEVKSNGDVWSGYIDVAHAIDSNYIIWVDESGTLKMNLRKFGKDSVKLNGVEVSFNIGYKYPSNGGTTIQQAHYVMSPSLDVPSRYKTLLNKLGK